MTRSYRFISEHRTVFGVTRLCRVLGMRRPGFYEWLAAAPTRAERAAEDHELTREITEVHGEHRGACGRPRVTVELRRRGRRVNHKRARRIMCEHGIVGLTRRRHRSLTRMFRFALAGHGMRLSVGRTGSCFDNAVAESFFATLKTESVMVKVSPSWHETPVSGSRGQPQGTEQKFCLFWPLLAFVVAASTFHRFGVAVAVLALVRLTLGQSPNWTLGPLPSTSRSRRRIVSPVTSAHL